MFISRLFTFAAKYYTLEPTLDETYVDIISEAPTFVENRLTGYRSIYYLIPAIINGILFFLFIITVIFLVIGGFTWILAGGNEERIGKAKKILMYAIIGLLIVIFSYAIVATLTGNYFYVPYFSPPRLDDSPFDQPDVFFNP